MSRFLLDTNTVSHFIKAHPEVIRRVTGVPMTSLCISSITEGELLFGLAKRPEAKTLHRAVTEFLIRVDVLPWDRSQARRYGTVRAQMEASGKILAPMDLLIAVQALEEEAVLVSDDGAFQHVPGLILENWTQG